MLAGGSVCCFWRLEASVAVPRKRHSGCTCEERVADGVVCAQGRVMGGGEEMEGGFWVCGDGELVPSPAYGGSQFS